LRRNTQESDKPAVIHLLSKTLSFDNDEIIRHANIELSLAKSLFELSINLSAIYYAVDQDTSTPVCETLPINSAEDSHHITIPQLDIWGVLVVGDSLICKDVSTDAPIQSDKIELDVVNPYNLIANGYLLFDNRSWQLHSSTLLRLYDEEMQSWVGQVKEREKQSSSARADFKATAAKTYHVSVVAKQNGSENDLKLTYFYLDAQGQVKYINVAHQSEMLTHGWRKLFGEFTLPDDISSDVAGIFLKTITSTHDIYFDRFELLTLADKTLGYVAPKIVIAEVSEVSEGDVINLDATASQYDDNLDVTFSWQQLSGTPVAITLEQQSQANLQLTTPQVNND
jgi:hypothetical protein